MLGAGRRGVKMTWARVRRRGRRGLGRMGRGSLDNRVNPGGERGKTVGGAKGRTKAGGRSWRVEPKRNGITEETSSALVEALYFAVK